MWRCNPNYCEVNQVGQQGDGKVNHHRLALIEAELRRCRSHAQIERAYAEKWDLSQRTIRNYIRAVYDEWKVRALESEPDPIAEFERTKAAFGDIYQRALSQNDLRAAIAALRERSHLLGLYREKLEITGPGGGPISLTLADARAELAQALEKLANRKQGGS